MLNRMKKIPHWGYSSKVQ